MASGALLQGDSRTTFGFRRVSMTAFSVWNDSQDLQGAWLLASSHGDVSSKISSNAACRGDLSQAQKAKRLAIYIALRTSDSAFHKVAAVTKEVLRRTMSSASALRSHPSKLRTRSMLAKAKAFWTNKASPAWRPSNRSTS